jgi:alpha-ketoglutarate-dependent 2,4-dichlorophenoxyacetate dioxygenase
MTLKIRPLTPEFAGEASGIDLRAPLTAENVSAIEAAMDRFAVLVWRDQPLGDAEHMAFSLNFGPLDPGLLNVTKKKNRFSLDGFVDIANVSADGELMARDNAALLSSTANQLWHTDSSFLRTVAKYSMLSAASVPDRGGDTEFADMRAAYDALPAETKVEIGELVAEHHALHSRMLLGNRYSEEQMATIPPAEWPLVRTHPKTGRKHLFLASHICAIRGLPVPEARMLVLDLIEHATRPEFVYVHTWRAGDLVMWDNRCTMHRGRRYDMSQRRDLRRTTVIDDDAR